MKLSIPPLIFSLSVLGLFSCGSPILEKYVAGVWSVTETYANKGPQFATWTITQNGGSLNLTSVRPNGSTVSGFGSVSGETVTFTHACFSGACGGCVYTFTGTISQDNVMSGDVVYCASDAAMRESGKWNAVKTGLTRIAWGGGPPMDVMTNPGK